MPEFTEVRLYGALGSKFGRRHRLVIDTPREAFRALDIRTKGAFGAYVRDKGRTFKVLVGDTAQDLAGLDFKNNGRRVSIVPAVQGNKDDFDRILAGIAIIVVSYYTMGTGGPAALQWAKGAQAGYAIGMSCVIGGAAQFIAGVPNSLQPQDKEGNRASYLFNGTVNTLAQGNPVPLLYGKLRVGGCVISGGINVYGSNFSNFSRPDGIAPDTLIKTPSGYSKISDITSANQIIVWADGNEYTLSAGDLETLQADYTTIVCAQGSVTIAKGGSVLGIGMTWRSASDVKVGDSLYGIGTVLSISDASTLMGFVACVAYSQSFPTGMRELFVNKRCGVMTDTGAILPCYIARKLKLT